MINHLLLKELESYISHYQIDQLLESSSILYMEESLKESSVTEKKRTLKKSSYKMDIKPTIVKDIAARATPAGIHDYINTNRAPKFNEVLFNFIDTRHLDDADVYKNANIDRRLFSKIRTHEDYKPKKTTALALGLSLKLSKEDMETLLVSAGYSLGKSDTLDLIIHFCLEKKIYNIYDVNIMLDYFSIGVL